MRHLTDPEIVRWLRRLRYDPEFHGPGRDVPISCFGTYIGLTRQTLYQLMLRRYPVSDHVRHKISWGVALVERGLHFERKARKWVPIVPAGALVFMHSHTAWELGDGHKNVELPQ